MAHTERKLCRVATSGPRHRGNQRVAKFGNRLWTWTASEAKPPEPGSGPHRSRRPHPRQAHPVDEAGARLITAAGHQEDVMAGLSQQIHLLGDHLILPTGGVRTVETMDHGDTHTHSSDAAQA